MRRAPLLLALALLPAMTSAAGLEEVRTFAVTRATFTTVGREPQDVSIPLRILSRSSLADISLAVHVPTPPPRHFELAQARCLIALSVNGKVIPRGSLPPCEAGSTFVADLSPYLHPGNNTLVLRVRNDHNLGTEEEPLYHHTLSMRVSPLDATRLPLTGGLLALVLASGIFTTGCGCLGDTGLLPPSPLEE